MQNCKVQQSQFHLCALYKLRFGESQVCPYKDLLQWSGDFMVPTPRRPPGLHRVLHFHWHVVSKHNPLSAAHFFFSSYQMCFLTHVHSSSSGVWAASFMKWSPGGLFSLDRLWRMSFTSYSASSVRQHSRRMLLCVVFLCALSTSFHLQICDLQVLPRKSRGPASPPARSLKPTNSLYTKRSLLSATHPGMLFEFALPRPKIHPKNLLM